MTAPTAPRRRRSYRYLSHAAIHSGAYSPVYTRVLCAVLEPGTGRYLGTAVAVLRKGGK